MQKSSLFYQQSLGMIQRNVTNSQFCSFCRQSSVHSSANYIHCSIKLSVLISQFTIIHNSHPELFPICLIKLNSWAFSFSLRIIDWVRSDWTPMYQYSSFHYLLKVLMLLYSLFIRCQWMSMTCLHSYISIYSKYDIPKYILHFCWLNAPFMNTRLVTMSASLRTQTGLHCLIIQVITQESDS